MPAEAVSFVLRNPLLMECVFKFLSLKSTLNLARVLDKDILKKSLSSKAWSKLVKHSCPSNDKDFYLAGWQGEITRELQVKVEKVRDFAAMLRLLKTPKVFQSKLLNFICAKFPSVLKGDRGIQVVGPGVADSKMVSSFRFLLLEEVKGVLGTTEMSISSMRMFNLVEPFLSAIGSRMTRQLLPVTSASIEMIQILDENSVQAFDGLMHIQQTTNMCLRVRGNIGRAGWEMVVKAARSDLGCHRPQGGLGRG